MLKHMRREAMAALGPVLYAARLSDGTIKIGHTTKLDKRIDKLASYMDCTVELLAFRSGSRADEAAIHTSLKAHRAHGHEYYTPSPEVLAVVNTMRDDFHLPHIAA